MQLLQTEVYPVSPFCGGNTKQKGLWHIKLGLIYRFQGHDIKSTLLEMQVKRQQPPCLILLLLSDRRICCRTTGLQRNFSSPLLTLHHIYSKIPFYNSCFVSIDCTAWVVGWWIHEPCNHVNNETMKRGFLGSVTALPFFFPHSDEAHSIVLFYSYTGRLRLGCDPG